MKSSSRLVFCAFFLLPALLAIAAITETLLISSDPKNSSFFGLSPGRLAIFGFLAITALFLSILAGLWWKYPARMQAWMEGRLEKKNIFAALSLAGILTLIISYGILAIPDSYLHQYYAIHEHARPLLAWFCIVSVQAVLGLLVYSVVPRLKEGLGPDIPYKKILRTGAVILGVLLAAWIFIAVTKTGVWPGNGFWGKAGVPILWAQILLAFGVSIAIQFIFINKLKLAQEKLWLDILICAAIWLAAFLLWNNQSFIPGVFNTPLRPPAFQIYPASDSQVFDLTAQNLLIGAHAPLKAVDKPIYIFFLALLHLLIGTDYSSLYLLQVGIFAFIPVIGYLVGKTVHSRQLGIMFGIILVFREQNAIALMNIIQVSTSKMILSEMLTAVGVLLFTLLLVKWLSKPDAMNPQLWMAGGILGLTGLVRLNALTIAPFGVLLIGLALKFKRKESLVASVLFISFLALSMLPWSMQSYSTTHDPFAFIKGKTNGVIVDNRYTPVITGATPVPKGSQTPDNHPDGKTESATIAKYFLLGEEITQHYVHNLISMFVMLPPSGSLYHLSDMAIRLPYWKLRWNGELQPDGYLILLMVLSFTSLGLSTAWVRFRAAGIAPLLVILGYNVSTALALTSGGRYMVPMDWGILLFFSIGVVEVAKWFFGLYGWLPKNGVLPAENNSDKKTINYMHLISMSLLFLVVGSTPVLLRNLPPTLYPPVSRNQLMKVVATIPELSTGESRSQISLLLKDPLIQIENGRAAYPRYYPANQGEIANPRGPVLLKNYAFNRLTFYMIGTESVSVIFPMADVPKDFNTDADIWVIGCPVEKKYLEAILVILQYRGSIQVYRQTPPKTSCQ